MYKTINEIKTGKVDSIIVLVKSISSCRARNGNVYQKVHVRDQAGNEATFMQFDCMLDVQPPLIMEVKITCEEYGASASFKIQQCREAPGYSMEAFLPKARIDRKNGWSEIVTLLKPIRPSLCRVACSIISDSKSKFLMLPLNPIGAFARQSGILEATIKLAHLAEKAAEQDVRLDRDLLISGAILYYCGNAETIDEGYENTVADLMYGSALSSYTLVQMKAANLIAANEEARAQIDPKDIMILSHVLAAKGRMVEACIPEASLLMHLDKMIQEVDAMCNSIETSADAIVVDPASRNRRLYNSKCQ